MLYRILSRLLSFENSETQAALMLMPIYHDLLDNPALHAMERQRPHVVHARNLNVVCPVSGDREKHHVDLLFASTQIRIQENPNNTLPLSRKFDRAVNRSATT